MSDTGKNTAKNTAKDAVKNAANAAEHNERHKASVCKIGVLGDKDSVLCFKAFGMDVYPAVLSEVEENRKIVDKMARNNYGIIFITEQIAQTIKETIDRYNKEMTPAIILIPSGAGSLGIGLARIRTNVEKAVGINILD